MNKKTILGVITTIILVAVIALEFVIGVRIFKSREAFKTGELINIAVNMGKPNTTVEQFTVYEEAPTPSSDGDVIVVEGIRLRINGTTDGKTDDTSQYLTFSDIETKLPIQLSHVKHTERMLELTDAINSYFASPANIAPLCNMLPVNTRSDNLTFYQQSLVDQNVPVIYDQGSDCYYMYYLQEDCYYVFSCKKPFMISKDKVTVHYSDPADDPLRSHTYSDYEIGAIANTRAQLGKDGGVSDNNWEVSLNKGAVKSPTESYTSEDDNKIRSMMVSYANYDWRGDGTAPNTTMIVDITSNAAKNSEWVLVKGKTDYAYSSNGLQLTGLTGSRNSAEGTFHLTGNVSNTLDSQRPFVIVLKFLDSSGQLLGVRPLDFRQSPIAANGSTSFNINITEAKDNIQVDQIASIMFEMH